MIVFAGRRMTVPMETFLNDTSKLKKVFEGKPGFEWVQSSEVVLEENTNTIRINGMPTNHGSPVVSFRIEENMNPQTTETRGFSYDFVASNIGGESGYYGIITRISLQRSLETIVNTMLLIQEKLQSDQVLMPFWISLER